MTTIRVAAVQLAVTEDVAANLATCLRLVDAAAARGAQLVVLPEFSNHVSWYDGRDHARRMAATLDGPFVAALAAKAAEHRLHLVAGLTLARDDGRTTGSNVLLGPDGTLLGTSDKQVLMGSERDHLDPAIATSPVVATAVGRLGLYSCMDGVVMETPRGLALAGAEVLCNTLNSFALDEASLHVPVRALENRVWVVAANKVGPLVPEHSIDLVADKVGVPVALLHGAGESQVVAPDGTVVAVGPRYGEAVVVADIELERAGDKRRPDGLDVIAARRPDRYAPLAAAPRGRQREPGAEEMLAAVVTPGERDDPVALAEQALRDGARLVVLPELPDDTGAWVDRARAALAAGGDETAVVVGSVRDGSAHVGVVVGPDGVRLRQPQLHRSQRHGAWQRALGDAVEVLDLPWGRLAMVVGDDAVHPETFRLAALRDADVVAVPFTVGAPHDVDLLLLERAAENRLNLAMASRPTPYGASALVPLSTDFTLWAPTGRPFAGVISRPELVQAGAPVTTAVLRPACAANRMVTRGTDLVDGRPWQLLHALLREPTPAPA